MGESIFTQTVPLSADADGLMRITDSRVTLDSVIHQFKEGASAEQIQEDFPSVALGDIYAVIAYYLHDRITVEAYLAKQTGASADLRKEIEAALPVRALRARLREQRGQPAA